MAKARCTFCLRFYFKKCLFFCQTFLLWPLLLLLSFFLCQYNDDDHHHPAFVHYFVSSSSRDWEKLSPLCAKRKFSKKTEQPGRRKRTSLLLLLLLPSRFFALFQLFLLQLGFGLCRSNDVPTSQHLEIVHACVWERYIFIIRHVHECVTAIWWLHFEIWMQQQPLKHSYIGYFKLL